MSGQLEVVQEILGAITEPEARRRAVEIVKSKGWDGMPDLSKVLPRGKGIQD